MTYSKGHIYRIVSISHPEIQWVGATYNQLRHRFTEYKQSFQTWKVENRRCRLFKPIYPYMLKYGCSDFRIILIKSYTVYDRKHLNMYKQLWINRITCINTKSVLPIPQRQNVKNDLKFRYKYKADILNEVMTDKEVYSKNYITECLGDCRILHVTASSQ